MSGGGLQYQLRCCTICALGFVICQFIVVLLLLNHGYLDDLITSRFYPRETSNAKDHISWREFVALGPQRPDEFYHYNRQLSDSVGIMRKLPETRHESCNTRTYTLRNTSHTKVSVVISFFNEARSTLLRMVISLVSRTGKDHLHELIIIDDHSQDVRLLEDLKELLNKMYATRGHLTLVFIRNLRRMGLIWSRNKGANVASGQYLFFLDSHCEVNEGWLEPLLDRLALNSSLAVSPLLDPIDPKTLSYRQGIELLKGGFDWSLHFHWLSRQLPEGESPATQYQSPAFAGGILMISRDWFLKLGGFNPHLQIWGGESIEFAIKLWLCGGQIEIVPCSRVGHIFRPHHAFQFPTQFDQQVDAVQATYLRNSKIIAESWLDEYKYLFYALKPAAKQIPLNHSDDDWEKLKMLKTVHRCQRFDWYLRHVYAELKPQHADFSALGTLRNEQRCVHVSPSDQLILKSCFRQGITQWHLHRLTGQLSTETNYCLSVITSPRPRLSLTSCLSNDSGRTMSAQRWQRRGTQLLHSHSQLCLDNPLENQLKLSSCRTQPAAGSQSFQFALEIEAHS